MTAWAVSAFGAGGVALVLAIVLAMRETSRGDLRVRVERLTNEAHNANRAFQDASRELAEMKRRSDASRVGTKELVDDEVDDVARAGSDDDVVDLLDGLPRQGGAGATAAHPSREAVLPAWITASPAKSGDRG